MVPIPLKRESKYFVQISNKKLIRNVNFHGESRDQGVFKELISEEMANDLYLGIGWLKPGEVHILHHHPDVSEFYFVLKGSAKITVGDETMEASQGTACYIPVGVKHKIVNDGPETFIVLFGYNRSRYTIIWDE